jgi:hemerythrin-like domain-containing protein
MADSRDMIVVHRMFRRQFASIPGLVHGVAAGNTAGAAVVADHVEWMVRFLHSHHEGEDMMVWPRLLERCPADVDPLIFTMESQHVGLAEALDSLAASSVEWRRSAAEPDREALTAAATALLDRIAEHLDLEELKVLSLIDRHLTEKEWKQVGGSGLKTMKFAQLTVAFGMILDQASPDQVAIMRNTIPSAPWAIFALLGPRSYTRYTRRLQATQDIASAT